MKMIKVLFFLLLFIAKPIEAAVKSTPTPAGSVNLKNEYSFGVINSLGQAFGYLITPGFSIAATAVIFYFLIGAFKIITGGGDKNAVAQAREMIVHAIIGFILLMLMFLILQFVPEFLGISNEYKIIK